MVLFWVGDLFLDINLFWGNVFSFLAVVCLAVSVTKKNKTGLIGWQVVDVVFCMMSNVALFSYSAFTTNFIALIRNVLAYKNKLSKSMTFILFLLCIIVGSFANTRGIIGWFPIAASASYTVSMYTSRNDQHMRYALISNLILWFVHDIYVQAYPSACADIVLSFWTSYQALKQKKSGKF